MSLAAAIRAGGPFCWRELCAVGRSRALAALIGLHVSVLTAFLLLWGEGMPVLAGANVYEQLLSVQRALLVVLLPWMAVRCATAARGDELVMLSVAAAVPASRVVLAQCLGRAAALAAVVIVGLPLMLVALQASALPVGRLAADVVSLVGLCAAVSVAVSWSIVACRSRIAAWLVASAVVVGLSWITAAGLLVWWLGGLVIGGALALALVADSRFRYLSDEAWSA